MNIVAKTRDMVKPSMADYFIVKLIARGGFGKVMLFQKKNDLTLHAAKIIEKSFLTKHNYLQEWVIREKEVC